VAATRIGRDVERAAALEVYGLLDTELEARFESFLAMVADFFRMHQAAIAVASDYDLVIKASVGLGGAARIPLEGSFTEAALIRGTLIVVEDGATDPVFRDHPSVVGAPYLRSFAVFPIRGAGDERIGVFALADPEPRTFSPADLDNIGRIVDWVENELATERESQRARDVQRALQPPTGLTVPGYAIDGTLIASHEVGGDFYDWHATGTDVTISLGDVMGKGTGAALLAATVRGALKTSTCADRSDIRAQLTTTAVALDEEFNAAGAFTTLFHAHLDAASGLLTFIDAGHGLATVIGADGSRRRLDANNPPFGLNPPTAWATSTTRLDPGDTLIVVSDGLLELGDGSLAGLAADLTGLHHEESLTAAARQLIEERTGRPSPPDDVCVIRIHRD